MRPFYAKEFLVSRLTYAAHSLVGRSRGNTTPMEVSTVVSLTIVMRYALNQSKAQCSVQLTSSPETIGRLTSPQAGKPSPLQI